ncbi:hypothetical protein AAFF_G00365490 [Aldrovandia affinis]|uniref:Uncharacterized protein n=1 Tax=Aldrovandia affinis TaxID=143900 RepID=A0AAD7VZB6_9TELE|nr:hypothetical protein AAFF_G00365490 [Aldrovandia affinis]
MLMNHYQSCTSLDAHLEREENRQPYLLASGTSKEAISSFFIVFDKKLIPCEATTSLAAIDELFKKFQCPLVACPDLRGPRDDEKMRDPWCPRCGACGAMPRVQERIAREGRAVGVRRAAESARAEAAVGAGRAAGAMKVL